MQQNNQSVLKRIKFILLRKCKHWEYTTEFFQSTYGHGLMCHNCKIALTYKRMPKENELKEENKYEKEITHIYSKSELLKESQYECVCGYSSDYRLGSIWHCCNKKCQWFNLCTVKQAKILTKADMIKLKIVDGGYCQCKHPKFCDYTVSPLCMECLHILRGYQQALQELVKPLLTKGERK